MRRRGFRAGGAAVNVLLASGCSLPVVPKRPAPTTDDAVGWIRHDAARCTLRLPRAEMGQNIDTGLGRIAAAQLGIAEEALRVELPATNTINRVKATDGSDSVKDFALPLRIVRQKPIFRDDGVVGPIRRDWLRMRFL